MRAIERHVAAWRDALAGALAVGRGLTPTQWDARTGCPDWTVGDVYRHLIGGELWMRDGGAAPDRPLAEFVQDPIDLRRGQPMAATLDELTALAAERDAQLAADPLDPRRPAATAWGAPVTYERQLLLRAFDLWVHEQDIRWAVGAPDAPTGPGAWIARELFLQALPRTVGRDAAAPPGSTVRITVVGEPGWDVAVRVDPDRRARPVPIGPATVHLTLSWPEYVRRGCGRAGAPADVWVSGDPRLADRILAALAITP